MVIEYCLAQKWALMPPSFGGGGVDGDEGIVATYRDFLVKFLTSPINEPNNEPPDGDKSCSKPSCTQAARCNR